MSPTLMTWGEGIQIDVVGATSRNYTDSIQCVKPWSVHRYAHAGNGQSVFRIAVTHTTR